jgi:hypothetical protein
VGEKPTSHSVRLVKDGVPISEKAARRMEELNNISGNSFALLNSVDHNYLNKLAHDSRVVLGECEEEVMQQLDMFKA